MGVNIIDSFHFMKLKTEDKHTELQINHGRDDGRLRNILIGMTARAFLLTKETIPNRVQRIARLEDLRVDVNHHIDEAQTFTTIYSASGRHHLVGYVCTSNMSLRGINTLHLEGLVVAPSAQGRGIGKIAVNVLLALTGAEALAMHTSNYSMLRLARSIGFEDRDLTKLFSPEAHYDDNFGHYVVGGRYPIGGLYGSNSENMVISGLNYQGGDAIAIALRVFRRLDKPVSIEPQPIQQQFGNEMIFK